MTAGDDDNESPERTEVVSFEEAAARRKKRLGRYVLERIIAEGGMAEIWLASAEGPGQFSKKVVVKRIRPELVRQALRQGGDDGANLAMEMFVREARLLASLEHRHIVQVFEFGVQPAKRAGEPPEHFIVMEVLEGLSLRDLALRLWQAKRPLPVEAVVQIVADACLGLEHAHRLTDERGQPANLVHRDISPDNIFVTTTGVAKLLDFGIAKREDWSNLTVAGELKGKVPYMSPEQLKGLRVDGRTDLFAVGIVLYWLLGGRRPFDGPSDIFTMKAILDDEPAPLRSLNVRVPALVADVVASCLAKEPEQRISSAAALHDALSMVLLSARGAAPDIGALVLGALELPHTSYELMPEIAAAPVQLWPGMPGYSSSSTAGAAVPTTSSSSSSSSSSVAGQSRSERRAPSFDKDSPDLRTAHAPEIGKKVSDIVLSRPSSSALPSSLPSSVPNVAQSNSGDSDDPRTMSLSLDDLPTAPPSQPVVDPVRSSSAPRVPTPGSMPALIDPAATIGLADFTGDDLATVPLQALNRANNAHLDLPPSSSKSAKAPSSPSPSPSPSSIEQAGPTSALNPILASTVMEQAGPTSTSTNALPPPLLDAAPTMLDMPFPAAVAAAEAEARARQPSRSIPSSSLSSSSSPSLSRTPSRAISPQPTAPVRRRRRRWQRFIGPLLAGGGSALVVIVGLSWALGLWPTADEPVVPVVPVVAVVADAGVVVAPVVDAGAPVVAVVDAGVADAGVVADADVVADAGVIEVPAVPAVPSDDVEEDECSDDEPEPTPSSSTAPTKKPKTPKKSKKPVAVVAKGKGFLVVQVRPWAKVSVDGTPMGTTPLPAFSVSAGRHKVKLEHEGQVKTRTVDVSANTTATVQVVFDRTATP